MEAIPGLDATISIKSRTFIDGDEDVTQLFTQGRFYRKQGRWYITYEETNENGYDGCRTTVKVEPGQISLIRQGEYHSRLLVQENQRSVGYYTTPVGEVMLGVSAREIINRLTPQGGSVCFSYSLDLNTSTLSDNEVEIEVSPNRGS